ncbi:MAG TPA: histidine kinase [Cryptosporangiaceae bacterium]|nr:histidine kinase [Cryptosporangiaceae bacterium]
MTGKTVWVVELVCGAAMVCLLLASPALFPAAGADLLLAAVLPTAFFGCGALARVLRPRHLVGQRLLLVGLLHLAAVCLSLLAYELPVAGWVSYLLDTVSAALFALGFVAMLDLLARYPDGRYLRPVVGRAVAGLVALAVVLVGLGALGSQRAPSVLGYEGAANPVHIPALGWAGDLVLAVSMVPVLGLMLLVARYPRSPAADRVQMRWPLVTTVVVAAGLVTTGLLEDVLGPAGQAAVFVPAAAALPASFLIGLLRHSEEAERVAAVAASRARLVEAATSERRRIERDLHDGAQQRLIGLLARVELARERVAAIDPQAAREFEEIREGIRSAHQELRELAQGIYPPALSDHGLAEAVRSAMARMPGSPTLVVAREVESTRYGLGVESAVYMFVLECLTNAMKHTDDDAVRVELAARGDGLVATVTDRGPGLPAEAATAAGLTGLRDRLAAVGGRLEVDSGVGGTRLSGFVPVVQRG